MTHSSPFSYRKNLFRADIIGVDKVVGWRQLGKFIKHLQRKSRKPSADIKRLDSPLLIKILISQAVQNLLHENAKHQFINLNPFSRFLKCLCVQIFGPKTSGQQRATCQESGTTIKAECGYIAELAMHLRADDNTHRDAVRYRIVPPQSRVKMRHANKARTWQ